jgi:hypothetical protein
MQQQKQLNVFMHQSSSLLLSSLHTMASLKTLSQASSLARNAHNKRIQNTTRHKNAHKKRSNCAWGSRIAERGRERVGKGWQKSCFTLTERRKKVEREPPRNAEEREKGSKKVGLKPPRTGEGGGKRVTKSWIRLLEGEGKRWTKKVAAFNIAFFFFFFFFLPYFLLYDKIFKLWLALFNFKLNFFNFPLTPLYLPTYLPTYLPSAHDEKLWDQYSFSIIFIFINFEKRILET